MKRTRLGGIVSAALCMALLIGACGDDDDDDEAGGTSPPAPAPAGPAINIGFINTENSPAGNYADVRAGAEAAVQYVNEELGGVAGRPLEMETCITDGSGESSIRCANQFVQSGKAAVTFGVDFGGAGSTPVLAGAGIPVIGGLSTESQQLTSTNNFLTVGGVTGAIPAISRYVGEELQPSRVAVVAVDLPVARLGLDQFSRPILAKYGITDINAVYESPTAADWTPALTKANEGNPDAVMVFVGGEICEKVLLGAQTVGIPTSKMIYPQSCTAKDQLEAVGGAAEGIIVQSPFLSPDADDEQVQTYRDAMEDHGTTDAIGPNSQSGFSFVMNLVGLLQKTGGDISKESLTTAVKSAVNEPNYMAHPYTCDGRQVPNLPAICNVNERILKYEGGTYSDLKNDWVEGVSQLGP